MSKVEEAFAKAIVLAYVIVGMFAGLAAAYGAERHAGGTPSRGWFINRLLLMPMSAVVILYAVAQFELTNDAAVFFSSLLSFLAYDAFQILKSVALRRARKEVENLTDLIADPSTYTKIEPKVGENGQLESLDIKVVKPPKEAGGDMEVSRIKPILKQAFRPAKHQLPNKLTTLTSELEKLDRRDPEDPKIQS